MYLQNHHLTKRVGASIVFLVGWNRIPLGCLKSTSKFPAKKKITRWWFQRFFLFTPIWGRFPICLLFLKGVGSTTNQKTGRPLPPFHRLGSCRRGGPDSESGRESQETWSKFRERKFPPTCRWFQVFLFYPVTPTWVGRWSNLTIFQTGWNQRLASGILNLELFWVFFVQGYRRSPFPIWFGLVGFSLVALNLCAAKKRRFCCGFFCNCNEQGCCDRCRPPEISFSLIEFSDICWFKKVSSLLDLFE